MIAPEVSEAVDRPGDVENTNITKNGCEEKGRSQRFSPEIPRDKRGQNVVENHEKWQKKPMCIKNI